jgi:thiamine-monophosphate kinase
MTPKKRTTEGELISSFEKVIETLGTRAPGLVTGVGDDAAVFRGTAARDFVVTQDVQVEGRHFERRWFSGRTLGRRLASVNLSDIAAMGARPLYGLYSLVLPADIGHTYLRQVTAGIVTRLSDYGASLIGGNVSGTSGPLTCDLTLIGDCPRGRSWHRRARPGDAIVLVGAAGEAAAGLERLRAEVKTGLTGRLIRAYTHPEPLLDVARALDGQSGIRGAIDVSDGLSTDLLHLCDCGGTGCEIDAAALPVSRSLAAFCRERGVDPVDWILRGGEDYALILAVAPHRASHAVGRIEAAAGRRAAIIGHFTRRPDGRVVLRGEKRSRLRPMGWDHLHTESTGQ